MINQSQPSQTPDNKQSSMKELQQQAPKRVNQQGNPTQGPRLAQEQRPQTNAAASAVGQKAKKEVNKWIVWAAGGGTIGAAGISTWFLI